MRIAHVTDCYLPRTGGIETQVRALALAQLRAGHDVRIITATPGHGAVRSGQDSVDGLRVDRVAAHVPFELPLHPRTRHHVSKLLLDEPVDVVHVHAGVVSPFAWGGIRAALEARTPVLVTVHSVWDGAQQRLISAADRVIGWTARGVALSAVSQLAATHVAAALKVPVAVTPNGIDPTAWRVPTWTAGTGVLRVTSVMRMAPRKRAEPLIQILAAAMSELGGSMSATLVGDGPDRAAAERLARRLGVAESIAFTGRLERSGILQVFGDSDVYIQPSIKESFGIAALEARTAGLPVVARSQAGTTQFIHDGVEGLLAPDDDAMVGALVRLAREPELLRQIAAHNKSTEPVETWPTVLAAVERAYAGAARGAV